MKAATTYRNKEGSGLLLLGRRLLRSGRKGQTIQGGRFGAKRQFRFVHTRAANPMQSIPALRTGCAAAAKTEMADAHKCRFQRPLRILQERQLRRRWGIDGLAYRACPRQAILHRRLRRRKRW